MCRILAIALIFFPLVGSSNDRLAEIASYVNAMWYAEEYNELCPRFSIAVPISEVDLRALLVSLDGEDSLEKAARDPNRPEVNFRDAMKDLARESIERGCDSQLAISMRTRIEENLVVPDVVNEAQNPPDDI